ncbi:helix-turn-helix transcriptional regulator [Tahibacter caeni]|uniref:helix-turn-helix transcriptional regulator n=1 Tax=Tahibacter caeni TaxID=1453545 RepID=UPI0021497F81|nr:helix-turn-helix transcriptional regulator [Tahibacter caeni]
MLGAPTTAALQPFVELFWARAAQPALAGARERVLPSGRLHLALRLDGAGLRLYADAHDADGRQIANAVVAGVRTRPYFKDAGESSRSVGAVLRPGAARALFGCSAAVLVDHHVALSEFWGDEADLLLQRLAQAADTARQIELLQAVLLHRLQPVRTVPPPIADALAAVTADSDIAALVRACGCSHKHFVTLFRDAVGLPPKRYARVLRLQRALQSQPDCGWSERALAAGYSDQAHLQREFRALTGLTPQTWRRAQTGSTHHLPEPAPAPVNFVQDRPASRG